MATATPIPVQNLFYLLSYAWEAHAPAPETRLAVEPCTDLANLFAVLISGGIRRLIRRDGLHRAYVPEVEEVTALRGKLVVADCLKRNTFLNGRAVCQFDELSHDVLLNQILRSTLDLLLAAADLEADNRSALLDCRKWLAGISPGPLTAGVFRRLQFSGHTRPYRFLIRLCELIFSSLLPNQRDGKLRFQDCFRDEARMHAVFETFVRNFAARHAKGAKVGATTIQWAGLSFSDEARALLPQMRTDVTIEFPTRKLILDCKYYRQAVVSNLGRSKLHSAHLYQLFAYLQNKGTEPGWEKCEGMLLYPTVDTPLDCRYELSGHPVRVATLDLSQPWQAIHATLLGYLE